MTPEDKALLKQLFGWEPPKKPYREKKKLQQNWNGQNEQSSDMAPWSGQSDEDNPNYVHWTLLWHKDEERWTKW